MKQIIDLPEKTIAHIRSIYGHGYKGLYDKDRDIIVTAIYNGKPYENIHGKWIAYKSQLCYMCSECNYYSQNNLFKFCPNCGSRMTEGEDNE